ncbi:hypothetical protein [Streptomyces sp. DH37]|uniref:hypothetical protein n=1 Tax=Streptomyces sp. DH37 TaxID=3040122 RepID=UPI0024415EA7|nr:hypothetical protein [Streptomyces sp. DH37]MDG9703763.1 hypothetical protein [Streptomyces sp. DH37]
MPHFLIGLLLGALSGGVTYHFTADGRLAAIIGVIVFLAAWLGIWAVLVIDD